MELKDSKTKENLMRAFAGESQARNRYTFAAQLAMENNLYVIKEVFDLTAKQETEHAEVFYRFLKEIEGMEVVINGAGYPVNTSQNVVDYAINTQLYRVIYYHGRIRHLPYAQNTLYHIF